MADMLALASADRDVRELVQTGQIAATTAVKAIKQQGDGAGAMLAEAVSVAKAAGKKGKVSATRALRKPEPRQRAQEIEEDDAGDLLPGIEVGRVPVPGKQSDAAYEAMAAELEMLKRELARNVAALEQIAQGHEPIARGRARRVLGWNATEEAEAA